MDTASVLLAALNEKPETQISDEQILHLCEKARQEGWFEALTEAYQNLWMNINN